LFLSCFRGLGAAGLVGCEAAQDQVGDALGGLLVDRAAGDEKPIEERPAEHVESQLDVELGTQVAALDAAPKHLRQRARRPDRNPPRTARASPGFRAMAPTRFGISRPGSEPLYSSTASRINASRSARVEPVSGAAISSLTSAATAAETSSSFER